MATGNQPQRGCLNPLRICALRSTTNGRHIFNWKQFVPKERNTMPQSLSSVYLHLVFSTKNHRPWFRDASMRHELHAYLGGLSRNHGCPALIVGGVEDHVHVLARHGRTITQADWVRDLKRSSSLWSKRNNSGFSGFSWQAGYGLFSVSASGLDRVRDYILNQEEHHRTTTFQDEYRNLLRAHNLEWDERYVWD